MRSDGDSEIVAADSDRSLRRRDEVPEVSIGIREVLRLRAFWQIVIAISIGEVVAMTNLYHLPALIEYELDLWLASIAAGSSRDRRYSGAHHNRHHRRPLPRQDTPSHSPVLPSCGRWLPRAHKLPLPWHLLGIAPGALLRILLRLRLRCLNTSPPLDSCRLLRKTKLWHTRWDRQFVQLDMRNLRAALRRFHVRLHRLLSSPATRC